VFFIIGGGKAGGCRGGEELRQGGGLFLGGGGGAGGGGGGGPGFGNRGAPTVWALGPKVDSRLGAGPGRGAPGPAGIKAGFCLMQKFSK